MKIYIDESNTSGKKFENDDKKFLAASFVFHNEEVFLDLDKILQLSKSELKGSKLITRDYNEALDYVIKKLTISNNMQMGFFSFDTSFSLLLDRTYDIFYYFPQMYDENGYKIEKIRNIFCSEFSEHPFSFMKENYNISNIKEYMQEILDVTINKDYSLNLLKWFNLYKDIDTYSEEDNNHSKVIIQAIKSSLEIASNDNIKEVQFVIDDFNNIQTKNRIEHYVLLINPMFSNINISITFEKSEESIGIQVADWIATISRKVIENSLNNFDNYNWVNFHGKIIKWLVQEFINSNIQTSANRVAKLNCFQEWKKDIDLNLLFSKVNYYRNKFWNDLDIYIKDGINELSQMRNNIANKTNWLDSFDVNNIDSEDFLKDVLHNMDNNWKK